MSKKLIPSTDPAAGIQSATFQQVDIAKLPSMKKILGNKTPREIMLEKAEEIYVVAKSNGYEEGKQSGEKRGFENGFKLGRAEGLRQIRAEHEQRLQEELQSFQQRLLHLEAQILQATTVWYEEAEQRLAEIAVESTTRLLRTELQTEKETVVRMVQELIQEIDGAKEIRISINPYDHAILSDHKEALTKLVPAESTIEFVDDAKITGGCVIRTERGTVDVSLETLELIIQREAA